MSVVQNFGNQILAHLDLVKERKARKDDFYAALVGSGRYKPAALFPDFYPAQEQKQEEVASGDVEYDYSGVQWRSPGESGLDEFTQMQAMMRDSGIAVIEEEEGIIGDLPVGEPDEIEERESAEWV